MDTVCLKLSAYRVVSPPLWDDASGRHQRVLFATRTAKARVIDDESWANIEAGQFEALPELIRDALIKDEMLVPTDENELGTIMSRNKDAINEDDTLYMVIQPTAMCQLGCDYCGQKHSPNQLSEDHQDLLIARTRKQVAARPGLKALFVSWFGGEPLLGLRVMRRLTPKFREIAAEAGLEYQAKLVSNGLALSNTLATEVVGELGVRQIEITLDGDAAHHDARRGKKGGAPTFNKILSNVIQLAERSDLPVELGIRCNVDRRNSASVSALIAVLAEAGLQDKVEFYVASVYSWGNEAHRLAMTPDEFALAEIDWFIEQTRLGFRPSLLPSRKPIVCMAVIPDSNLVDAYGNIFNCTEVSYVPTYGTPNRFQLGHLEGEERTPQINLADFNDRIAAGELPCFSCRMLPVCGGSCPKKWVENLEPCPSAKRNIEQRLMLSYALSRLAPQAANAATLAD